MWFYSVEKVYKGRGACSTRSSTWKALCLGFETNHSGWPPHKEIYITLWKQKALRAKSFPVRDQVIFIGSAKHSVWTTKWYLVPASPACHVCADSNTVLIPMTRGYRHAVRPYKEKKLFELYRISWFSPVTVHEDKFMGRKNERNIIFIDFYWNQMIRFKYNRKWIQFDRVVAGFMNERIGNFSVITSFPMHVFTRERKSSRFTRPTKLIPRPILLSAAIPFRVRRRAWLPANNLANVIYLTAYFRSRLRVIRPPSGITHAIPLEHVVSRSASLSPVGFIWFRFPCSI